jgi:hypothetical protein
LKTEFDLSSAKQPQFMEELDRRCTKQGYKGTILTINGVYFLRNYGTFTYDAIMAHVCTYAFQEDREEQDATALLYCLDDTLSSSAHATLNAERYKYTITRAQVNATLGPNNQIQGNPDDEYQDGVLFLWCILNRTAPQTPATISVIIRQLGRLNNIMEESKSDILAFNTKTRSLLNQYVANTGHEYDKMILLTSLFEAYKIPTNHEFNAFVIRTEQDHNRNKATVTSEELLEATLKMYQTKIVDGSWDQLSNDQKQAINLMAQVKSYQAKLTPSRVVKSNKSSDGGQNYQPDMERMKKKYDAAPDWKKKKPSNINEPHLENGVEYYWCTKHGMYTVHKSNECKLPKANNFYKLNKSNNSNQNQNNNKEGGKKGNKGSKDKNKSSNDSPSTANKLQYTGTQCNMSVDSEYGDY